MATKKKTKNTQSMDMTLSIGDRVSIVSATIFDNNGKLSDLLATGTITKVDPVPGWDYEVTFDGELSLDGRDKMKSRLYNRHQIIKAFDDSDHPVKMESEIYNALRREDRAINNYNDVVGCINSAIRRMQSSTNPEYIAALNSDRLRYLAEIPKLEQEIKDARKEIADMIRSLLAENPDDKTSV